MRRIPVLVEKIVNKLAIRHSGINFFILLFLSLGILCPLMFFIRVLEAYEVSKAAGDEKLQFAVILAVVTLFILWGGTEFFGWHEYLKMIDLHSVPEHNFYCALGRDSYAVINECLTDKTIDFIWYKQAFLVCETAYLAIYLGYTESRKISLEFAYAEITRLEFIEKIATKQFGTFYGFKLVLVDGRELPFCFARRGTFLNMQMPRAKAYALFEQLRDEIMRYKQDNTSKAIT